MKNKVSIKKVKISKREIQILQEISFGLTNKEIASKLKIKETTIKTHLRRIGRKTGAKNRSHAIAQAFRNRLIR